VEPPADAPPPREAGPPPPAGGPPPPDEPPRCQRCGAPHDPYQEYCLECGARLARLAPAGRTVLRRDMWTRDSPLWFWATFLALLLVALIAGAIVLAATRGPSDEEAATTEAGGPTTSVLTVPTDPFETDTIVTETFPGTNTLTVPTLPTTGTTGVTPPPPPPPPAEEDGIVISWPTNESGYTVILSSTRESSGRAVAERKAREAIGKGLTEVGILNSSDYSSLNSGYFVVFTGIHDTEAEGRTALTTVRRSGYPIAYLREITP
jgi:hypothetical protein